MRLFLLITLCLLPLLTQAGSRRARHLNPSAAGATLALDSRFISGLSDGDPVSTWSDRSGNGNNATGSGSSRPTFETNEQGGNPIVRFDGADDFMDSALVASQPLTVLILWKEHTDIAFDLPFYSTSPAGGVILGSVSDVADVYAGIGLLVGSVPFGSYNILTGVVNGASSESWLNGVQVTTGDAGSQGINTIKLGNNYSGSYFPDNIATVAVFPSNLSAPLHRRLSHAAAFSFKIPCS